MNIIEQLFTLLPDVSVASTFIPAILIFLFFKVIKRELSPILFLVALSLLTEFICAILPFYIKGSNIIVFNLYPIFEIISLSWFYIKLLDSKVWKYIIVSISIFYAVNSVIFICTHSLNKLNNVALAIESIFIILFSLVAFIIL